MTRTKIVATVGPSCLDSDVLRGMVLAGVDIFRLNFAHGSLDEKAELVPIIRRIGEELRQPLGILGDLSGPKIRLGPLPAEGIEIRLDERYSFVRESVLGATNQLTSSYPGLVDDLEVGNRVLLADGTVSLRVEEKLADSAVCSVEQPGRLLSRQGINLPGVKLAIACLTEKDRTDLQWALEYELDFIGLSFVRSANDIRQLRALIDDAVPSRSPFIVAKIEKPDAIDELDEILQVTDAAMVARGDLGVEVDIVRVPALQKRIIAACNLHRVPVITATQMLESMQQNDMPTRAEVTDVANAVLDGTDAVMLSGETAVGRHPIRVVNTMSRIAREAEPLLQSRKDLPLGRKSRTPATQMTLAVTLGAIHAAERLQARLLVLLTRSGITAMAVSELRSRVPILALTDDPRTAARLTLAWGVHTLVKDISRLTQKQVINQVQDWGAEHGILKSGDVVVMVGTTDWSNPGKDLMLVNVVP